MVLIKPVIYIQPNAQPQNVYKTTNTNLYY